MTAPAKATAPVGPYDLTTLAVMHDELGIEAADTSKDTFLQRAITQCSTTIRNYCNGHVFQVEGVSEEIWVGGGPDKLFLKRWPVVAIASLLDVDGVTELVEGTDYEVDPSLSFLWRLDTSFASQPERVPWIPGKYVIAYTGGATMPVVGEAKTVPANPGPYVVTVAQAAAFAADEGVTYANGTALAAVASNPAQGQYSVSAQGVYTFNAADGGAAVLISYLYAYIPDDIAMACQRYVTMRFQMRGRDPTVRQQNTPNVGDQTFWIGTIPGQSGALPPEIASLIDERYREAVFA